MKVKIFTHKLRVDISDDILKFQKYFKDNGVSLELDVENTLVPKSNALVNLILPLENKFDVVFYIYDKVDFPEKYFGNAYPLTTKLIRIFLATDKINDNVDYTWKSMCHEMMHALFFKYTKTSGEIPLDTMLVNGAWSPYYLNEEPYNPKSNFAEAWKILRPYLNQTYVPRVTLTRIQDDGTQTLGQLDFDGWNCKTLELPFKQNQKDISAIPKGVYKCKYTFSPRFLKYTYEVLNVPNRSGIRIHSGNYSTRDIQGCILLGTSYNDIDKDGIIDIINSRITISNFEKLMNKKPFVLQII
jgi:hypothetical protein